MKTSLLLGKIVKAEGERTGQRGETGWLFSKRAWEIKYND